MSVSTLNSTNIPAALPGIEGEQAREKLLEAAAAENVAPETLIVEDERDEAGDTPERAKASKKKLFFAFVCFVFFFVLLIGVLCWFFGIGFFAAARTKTIDRTAKTNAANTGAPATEDEKLRMALEMVAEKDANVTNNQIANASDSASDDTNALASESSVTVPSAANNAGLNEPVIVADASAEANRNVERSATPLPDSKSLTASQASDAPQNLNAQAQNNSPDSEPETELAPIGRSLFFGVGRAEKPASVPPAPNTNQFAANGNRASSLSATPIPFGTLLPIRFLGAVYTLRASGGLVRMELARAVSGKNYSYPSGTILVGTLRGSEYKRAFVSIVGLIEPETGKLVKFEGEVMGSDGASGVVGRRRKIKGAWSRALSGLRDAGAMALTALGNRRSGGTVVISDSTQKASGVLSAELGGAIVSDKRQANEFVEISAGSNAFVLVTHLPDEISESSALAPDANNGTGLTDGELADLFSEGSPARIRAALGKMTPQFRALAEGALATMEAK